MLLQRGESTQYTRAHDRSHPRSKDLPRVHCAVQACCNSARDHLLLCEALHGAAACRYQGSCLIGEHHIIGVSCMLVALLLRIQAPGLQWDCRQG